MIRTPGILSPFMPTFPGQHMPGQTPPIAPTGSGTPPIFGGQPGMPGILAPTPPAAAPGGGGGGGKFMRGMNRFGEHLNTMGTNPMFNMGMGLLASSYDGTINPAAAAMGGLQNATAAQQQQDTHQQRGILFDQSQDDRNRQLEVGQRVKGILSDDTQLADMPKALRESIAQVAELDPTKAAQLIANWQVQDARAKAAGTQARGGGFNPITGADDQLYFPGRGPDGQTILTPARTPSGAHMGAPLSTAEEGQLNAFNNTAVQASSDVARMGGLADRFDAMAASGALEGTAGDINEFLKGVLGSENEVSALRTEYDQFKNAQVVQNLPPGVASDRDIAIAMAGWPTSTSDSAHVASYLRGMQKLKVIEYAQAQHNQSYLGDRRSMAGMGEDWLNTREQTILGALQAHGLQITPREMSDNGILGTDAEPAAPASAPADPLGLFPDGLPEEDPVGILSEPRPRNTRGRNRNRRSL